MRSSKTSFCGDGGGGYDGDDNVDTQWVLQKTDPAKVQLMVTPFLIVMESFH